MIIHLTKKNLEFNYQILEGRNVTTTEADKFATIEQKHNKFDLFQSTDDQNNITTCIPLSSKKILTDQKDKNEFVYHVGYDKEQTSDMETYQKNDHNDYESEMELYSENNTSENFGACKNWDFQHSTVKTDIETGKQFYFNHMNNDSENCDIQEGIGIQLDGSMIYHENINYNSDSNVETLDKLIRYSPNKSTKNTDPNSLFLIPKQTFEQIKGGDTAEEDTLESQKTDTHNVIQQVENEAKCNYQNTLCFNSNGKTKQIKRLYTADKDILEAKGIIASKAKDGPKSKMREKVEKDAPKKAELVGKGIEQLITEQKADLEANRRFFLNIRPQSDKNEIDRNDFTALLLNVKCVQTSQNTFKYAVAEANKLKLIKETQAANNSAQIDIKILKTFICSQQQKNMISIYFLNQRLKETKLYGQDKNKPIDLAYEPTSTVAEKSKDIYKYKTCSSDKDQRLFLRYIKFNSANDDFIIKSAKQVAHQTESSKIKDLKLRPNSAKRRKISALQPFHLLKFRKDNEICNQTYDDSIISDFFEFSRIKDLNKAITSLFYFFCDHKFTGAKGCILKYEKVKLIIDFYELPCFLDLVFLKDWDNEIKNASRLINLIEILTSFLELSKVFFNNEKEIELQDNEKYKSYEKQNYIMTSRFHILKYLQLGHNESTIFAIYSDNMSKVIYHQKITRLHKVIFYYAFFAFPLCYKNFFSLNFCYSYDYDLIHAIKFTKENNLVKNNFWYKFFRGPNRNSFTGSFNIYIRDFFKNCQINSNEYYVNFCKLISRHEYIMQDKDGEIENIFRMSSSTDLIYECMKCYYIAIEYRNQRNQRNQTRETKNNQSTESSSE